MWPLCQVIWWVTVKKRVSITLLWWSSTWTCLKNHLMRAWKCFFCNIWEIFQHLGVSITKLLIVIYRFCGFLVVMEMPFVLSSKKHIYLYDLVTVQLFAKHLPWRDSNPERIENANLLPPLKKSGSQMKYFCFLNWDSFWATRLRWRINSGTVFSCGLIRSGGYLWHSCEFGTSVWVCLHFNERTRQSATVCHSGQQWRNIRL